MEDLTDLSDKIELLIGFRTFTVNQESRTSKLYEIVRDEDTGECKQCLSITGWNNSEGSISSTLATHLNSKSRILEAVYLPNLKSIGKNTVKQEEEHLESAFRIVQHGDGYAMVDWKKKEITHKETIDNAVNTILKQCASAFEEMEVEKQINVYLEAKGL
ncbi:hypothetical protein HZC30_08225 [Candidatus Woesearchaeota archaeon]|nr:hypothetical protein [Candidatus Woesearchaeota archaeon]